MRTGLATITRRQLLTGGTALVLLAAACAGDDDSSGAGTRKAAHTRPSKPAFPVTLQTTLGTVKIPAAPRRIVSLGTPDAAIALGALPVGIPRADDEPSGIHPWLKDAYAHKDVELIEMRDGIPYDKVAALKPDLIIATDIPVTPADYARLSRTAPVVTWRSEGPHHNNPWEDQTRLVGAALGLPDKADALVKKLDAHVTAVQDAHPPWNDKTFTYATFRDGTFSLVTDPDDGRFQLVELLGFVLPPPLYDATLGKGNVLGPTQIKLLDADLLVVECPDQAVGTLKSVSGFASVPAVKAGRYVTVSPVVGQAMRFTGAVNLRWSLEHMVPAVEKVVPT